MLPVSCLHFYQVSTCLFLFLPFSYFKCLNCSTCTIRIEDMDNGSLQLMKAVVYGSL